MGMTPSEHEAYNATHYPGTRQLCVECDDPTGRCEEDSIYVDGNGPLCEGCGEIMDKRMLDGIRHHEQTRK